MSVTLPRDRLRQGLERTGWEIVGMQTDDLGWWASEVWTIRSVWQPHAVLYVTFVVDPLRERPGRPKSEAVYLAQASIEPPALAQTIPDGPDVWLLGRHTARDLPSFLATVSEMRDEWLASGPTESLKEANFET